MYVYASIYTCTYCTYGRDTHCIGCVWICNILEKCSLIILHHREIKLMQNDSNLADNPPPSSRPSPIDAEYIVSLALDMFVYTEWQLITKHSDEVAYWLYTVISWYILLRKGTSISGCGHGRMGGGGVQAPPPFGPLCRLFNSGPKVGPPPGPPLFLIVDLRWAPTFEKSWIRPCMIISFCSKSSEVKAASARRQHGFPQPISVALVRSPMFSLDLC